MNLTDYLFHTPWWLPPILLVVGAIVFYFAGNRQETKARTAGLLMICFGILVIGVSYFVDTDLEKAEKNTRRIVEAFDKKDWVSLGPLLDNNTTVGIANALTLYRGRDQIVAKSKEASERYGFKSVDVTGLTSRQEQTLITITVSVLSNQDQTMGVSIPSRWEFDYLESADGWYLNEIRAVEIGRQQGEGMSHMFPKR